MSTTVSPTPISEHELERAERANATMGKFGMTSVSERENREIEAANASGNTPVVFIHGLWLLPSSWANWANALLWAADTDAIAVLVRDDSTSDQFELVVEPEDNPMHVYEHPYAYAAWRGIDYRIADLRHAA
jgi:hypothetical protein